MILNLLLRVKLSRSFVAIIELNVVSWLHLTLIRLFQIYLWKKFFPSLYFVISCFCMLRKESFPKCIHWNKNKISIVFQHKNTLSHILVEGKHAMTELIDEEAEHFCTKWWFVKFFGYFFRSCFVRKTRKILLHIPPE